MRLFMISLFMIGAIHQSIGQIEELLHRLDRAETDSALIEIYDSLSVWYIHTAYLDSSEYYIDKAVSLLERVDDKALHCKVLNNYGYLMNKLGNYDSAWLIHLRVLDLAEQGHLTEEIYQTKYFQGVTKSFIGDYINAYSYLKEAYDYFLRHPPDNAILLARITYNLASVAFHTNDLDNTIYYLNLSNEYVVEDKYIYFKAANLMFIGNVLLEKEREYEALEYYREASRLFGQTRSRLNVTHLYIGQARIFMKLEDLQLARQYVDTALLMAKTYNQINEWLSIYQLQSSYYSRIGRFDLALEFMNRYLNFRDSVMSARLSSEISIIEAEKESEEIKAQMSQLESQLAQQKRIVSLQHILITGAIVSLVAFAFIFYFYSRQTQRRNLAQKKLLEKSDQLELARNELIKSEKMAVLGRLSASIVHELNTPISTIKGNLELIQEAHINETYKLSEFLLMLNEENVDVITQMLIMGAMNRGYLDTLSSLQERQLLAELYDTFREIDPERAHDLAVAFLNIGIISDVRRFEVIYKDPECFRLLDMIALFVVRYNAAQMAGEAMKSAERILLNLRSYSFKKGWITPKPFNLIDNIVTVMALHESSLKGIQFIKEFNANPVIRGFPDELGQVWSNLISNAAYEMQQKGEIIVRVDEDERQITVEVEDTGGGVKIDNEDIFDIFFTTKPEGEGTGIGLSLSRDIVKKHNADLRWRNTGKGAVFSVVFNKLSEEDQ